MQEIRKFGEFVDEAKKALKSESNPPPIKVGDNVAWKAGIERSGEVIKVQGSTLLVEYSDGGWDKETATVRVSDVFEIWRGNREFWNEWDGIK